MTEDFSAEALHYLLDELDPARRAAFAERLARDPVAAEAFKACTDSLAQFAIETAPPVSVPEPDRRAEIAVILAAASASAQRTAPEKAGPVFGIWLWPVAAAVLLLLNLAQFLLDFRLPFRTSGSGSLASDSSDPSGRSGNQNGGTETGGPDDPSRTGADAAPLSPEARVNQQLARLESLQREYKDLQKARDALNAEYDHAILQLTRRALVEQGISRLAAMEMVDANSYARGDRKGLMSLAKALLTQPGVVTDPGGGPAGGQMGNSGFGPTTPPTTANPYAWSVFDEKENQGYLNLYNLPTVANDQALQVWVKPVDATDFRPVGVVPAEFYGKSGTVSYTLPAGSSTPVEILITLEPRTAQPTRPTGNVVLRGP